MLLAQNWVGRRRSTRRVLGRIIGLLPAIVLPAVNYAATYYASPTGSDSNPGTYSQPFRTVARSIQAVSAGDTIILKDGVYPADTPYGGGSTTGWLLWISKSGTPSAPITLKAENKQKAILDCGNKYNQGQTGCMGYFYLGNPGPAYWIFQDLVVTNTYDIAFLLNSSTPGHDITVKGCRFEKIGQHVSSLATGMDAIYANQGHYNLVFDGNVFADIGRLSGSTYPFNDHAIYVHSSNTTIMNNVFYGNISGWGVQTASGFSGTITNNTFAFTAPNSGGQVMLWDPASGPVSVTNNVFYQPPKGFAVNTCALSAPSCTLDHNLVYGGSIGGAAGCGATASVCSASNTTGGDPLFTSISGGDFRLQAGSAAIDAATPSSASTDYDGAPRPQGAAPDLGAFEYAAPAATTISGLGASNLTSNSATITWATSALATSQVCYGVSSCSLTSPLDSNMTTQHSITLSSLSAAATYQYAAISKDASGKTVTSSILTFTTPSAPVPAPSTPSLTVSSLPATVSIPQGEAATVTITPATSLSGLVYFSASGVPSGVTAAFSLPSCTLPCSTQMTLSSTAAAAVGAYSVAVTGSVGGSTASANVTLSIVAPAGKVADWGFNEGYGLYAADLSGNKNTGQLMGKTKWTSGTYGTALYFNGSSSYVSVADNSSLDLSTGMTVAFWINAKDNPGIDQRIVSKNYAWEVKLNGRNHIPQFSSGSNYATLNYALPMGTWQHVVFTFSSGVVKGYVNGVQVSLGTNTFPAGFTLPIYKYGLYIGADAGRSMFAKGMIDGVRIYNQPLSASQIAALYSQDLH